MIRASIALACLLVVGCGHADAPVAARPQETHAPPPPPPSTDGPRACSADADCAGLPPRDGTAWRCAPGAFVDQLAVGGLVPGTCQPMWPDGKQYCDTSSDCPMRPPIPDYTETVECANHHCITHGHPGMDDLQPHTGS